MVRRRWCVIAAAGDIDQPPARFQDRKTALLHRAAHGIENHVAGRHGLGEIVCGIIDHPIGAEPAHVIDVPGRGGGIDRGAGMFRDLDGESADTPGAALDQDRFSRLDLGGIFHRNQRRQADQGQGRGLHVAEAVGLRRHQPGVDGDGLGVGAVSGLRGDAEHGIPWREFVHPGAGLGDHAGKFAAEDHRQRRSVAPHPGPGLPIDGIDGSGMDGGDDLPNAGPWVRHLAQDQDVRFTVRIDLDRFHGSPPSLLTGFPWVPGARVIKCPLAGAQSTPL